MGDTAGALLEDFYYRQFFNTSLNLNIENSFQSLETLTNESSNQLRIITPERNVNFEDVNSRHNRNDNLFEDENKLSDKSTTLFRNSHEYDTLLPSIESVVTDNDLSDLAHEFEEYGKSFTRDNISIKKEERDNLFPISEPAKKDFSKKFRVEIDPKSKYTYNNLYNINTEIFSPTSTSYKFNNKNENEEKKFVNDGERLDLRFIQNALLFNNKKGDRELYNPNENILKALNDTNNKRNTKSSFIDIDFDLNTKHLSAITKVEKDNFSINEDDDISLYSKNKMSYQNTRPTYLTNHQPSQPIQSNFYNKTTKRVSSSPKPSPLSESNTEHYNRMENNYEKTKINDSFNFKDYLSLPFEKEMRNSTRNIHSKENNVNDSKSSDDIPLANITERRIKPLSTPSLSTLSISVPGDKKSSMNTTNNSVEKSKKLNSKPLIDLTEENENVDYLKSEFENSIANDNPKRKVSTKMSKKKKKKYYFSYCCSSKVLENSFIEEGSNSSRYINKDLYIKHQKEQIHSFEVKRLNNSKEKSSNSSSSISQPSNKSNRKSIVSFKPNYLSRRSDEYNEMDHENKINRNQSLSSVSSVDDKESTYSDSTSLSSNASNYSSEFESMTSEKKFIIEMNNYLDINLNKSPPKSIIVPTNQTNSQYIQSRKSESPSSFVKTPSSPNNNISKTQNTKSTISNTSSFYDRKKQHVKYCTSYEIDENGNWKLVERRYNDSKILKVETINRKMI